MTSQKRSRRAVLGSSAAILASLSGCTSIVNSLEQRELESTSQPPTADSNPTGTALSLYASTDTTTFGVDLTGNPLIGSPDAHVDMYYWSDFQCPFCNRFEQNTAPKLIENDVSNGNLRIVLLELPNIGDESTIAAAMSKCVWDQVKADRPDVYYRWHSAVFDAQKEPNSGWAVRENLHAITESVGGVDAEAVHSCLENRRSKMKGWVEQDLEQADEQGIGLTPGFALYNHETENAKRLTGAQPYERFKSEIEKLAE
ncbi:DsbA family protein [Haladaptatus sp. GCM10025707]|uniref:DsbA family protein n=1 Tax=unclassified Haladaptatus TaxID=2622732 RepID=UPI0023E79D5C|nr:MULTISPECIES: thioredoxin domain-containing protein [unclassified Haladaptatus]